MEELEQARRSEVGEVRMCQERDSKGREEKEGKWGEWKGTENRRK